MKIGYKIIIPIICLVGLAVSVSSAFLYTIASKAIQDRTLSELRGISELKKTELENYFNNAALSVNRIKVDLGQYHDLGLFMDDWDRSGSIQLSRYDSVKEQLLNLLKLDNSFSEYSLLDVNGTVVLSTTPDQEEKIKNREDFFVNGKKGDYIEAFIFDPATLQTVSIVTSPITNAKGDVVGVIAAKLNLDSISRLMSERGGLGETGETYLVNKYNTFITESRFEKNAALKKTIHTEGVNACLLGNSVSGTFLDYRNVSVIGYYFWLPDSRSCLVAEIDESEALGEMHRLRDVLYLGGGLLFIIITILSSLLASLLTRRISILQNFSRRFGEGDFSVMVPITSNDEIGQLGTIFNQMAKQLKQAYEGLEQRVLIRTRDLKQAEIEQRKQKEFLNNLFSAIPENVYWKDTNHVFLGCNRAFAKLVSLSSPEEIVGKVDADLPINPELIDYNIGMENQVIETKQSLLDVQQTVINKGEMHVIQTSRTPLINDQGKLDGVLVTFSSITDLVMKERKLAESEQRLSTILEAVKEGITLSDAKGHFYLFNNEMVELTGYTKEEANAATDFNRLLHPDLGDANAAIGLIESYGVQDKRETMTVIHRKDGQVRDVLVSTVVIESDGQKMFLSAYRDVTVLKQANAALVHEKALVDRRIYERTHELETAQDELKRALQSSTSEAEKTLAIINSIGDGVFVLDHERKIVLVNPITEQLSGYSRQELIGTVYTDNLKFIYEQNRMQNSAFVDQVYEQGTLATMTNHTLLIGKDGHELQVADSAAPLKDGEGNVTGCVVVFRDVSKAREVERMKDEFISIASHQLRTPLTALRWLTERMQKDPAKTLTESQQELVGDMRMSTKRLITLVNDLLNISRIESGRIMVEPQPTKLQELIASVVEDVKVRSEEKHQHIVVSSPDDLPEINIDQKLVRQAYQNLLVNSVKYSPEGSSIEITLTKTEDMIRSEICDMGYGIPMAQQNRLFEKFFRADNVVGKDSDGSGLGLYLVKKIIAVSGGSIGFKSPLKTVEVDGKIEVRGTLFWFTLPLAGSEAQKGEVSIN